MSSAITQTLTLVEGSQTETPLRQVVRGGALALSGELDAAVLAAADSWHFELHQSRVKDAAALFDIVGVVSGGTVTFTLTLTHTNRDLGGEIRHNFWYNIYALEGAVPTVYQMGDLPIVEPNVALLSTPIADPLNNFPRFLNTITGYTGGAATALDSVVTVGLSVPRLYAFKHATDGGRLYLLRAGTDAESSPAIIRPDDFHATTNAKVFESFM